MIDRRFRDIYEGRTEHPLEEGEVADLLPDGELAATGETARKRGNETPIFSDVMTHVVMSPYWNIPDDLVKNNIAANVP